jgi:hypothetical protein
VIDPEVSKMSSPHDHPEFAFGQVDADDFGAEFGKGGVAGLRAKLAR